MKTKISATFIENEILKVKFIISHPMLTQIQAQRKGIEQDYITHIVMKAGTRVLFEFRPSEFVSKSPLFKFKVRKKELKIGDVLELEWKTLLGKTDSYMEKIS